MKIANIVGLALMAASAMSCATGQKSLTLDALSGEWAVVSAVGQGVKASDGQDAPFIGIDTNSGRVYGSTGCNRLMGTLNADPAKQTIDFGATGSTRMMCLDMDTEQRVLEAMGKARTFALDGEGGLTLIDEGGNTVMELRRTGDAAAVE